MDIGIRALKSRRSEIVDRAAAGETIRVTERGRPKAILGPIPGTLDLRAAADQGWITTGDGTVNKPRRALQKRPAELAAAGPAWPASWVMLGVGKPVAAWIALGGALVPGIVTAAVE
jgi:prevent-host-death family protein